MYLTLHAKKLVVVKMVIYEQCFIMGKTCRIQIDASRYWYSTLFYTLNTGVFWLYQTNMVIGRWMESFFSRVGWTGCRYCCQLFSARRVLDSVPIDDWEFSAFPSQEPRSLYSCWHKIFLVLAQIIKWVYKILFGVITHLIFSFIDNFIFFFKEDNKKAVDLHQLVILLVVLIQYRVICSILWKKRLI